MDLERPAKVACLLGPFARSTPTQDSSNAGGICIEFACTKRLRVAFCIAFSVALIVPGGQPPQGSIFPAVVTIYGQGRSCNAWIPF